MTNSENSPHFFGSLLLLLYSFLEPPCFTSHALRFPSRSCQSWRDWMKIDGRVLVSANCPGARALQRLGMSLLCFFLTYYAFKQFSRNVQIMLKKVPHYARVYLQQNALFSRVQTRVAHFARSQKALTILACSIMKRLER